MTVGESSHRRRIQGVGRIAGPLAALLTYLWLPDAYAGAEGQPVAFSHAGRATGAVAVWMATWWLTEAIEVYATALLPLVLLPLLGAREMKETASAYAHPLIFLFMGGFLVALAMQRWSLHRRIALVALRLVGDRPTHMVGGFMLVTAGLSMWVSNTATAIMMLPVAISVIDLVNRQRGLDASAAQADPVSRNLALGLLLGIAYAASIGGVATPIGTPPNLFLLSFVRSELGLEISFVRWMGFALPLVAVLLPITWWLLTRWLFPVPIPRIEGGAALVRDSLTALGPVATPERRVAAIFGVTCLLWVTRPLWVEVELAGYTPFAGLTDAGIAMTAALTLFVLPAGGGRGFLLDWETARSLPWGILVLFGGGLSLAGAIGANGVGELLTAQVAGLAGVSPLLLLAGVVILIVFLTELTSNTATTAALIPVLAAFATGLGLQPLELIVPAAIAASCAFMLPVATPPNAIVFGSGLVSIREMSRAGFWLNWIAIVLVTAFSYSLVLRILT